MSFVFQLIHQSVYTIFHLPGRPMWMAPPMTLSLMWHSTPPVEGQERVVDLFSWWRVMFSSWSLLDSTVRFFTKESTQQEEGMVNVRGGAHRSSMHWWTVWTVIRYPVVKLLNPTSVSCWWSSRHFIAAENAHAVIMLIRPGSLALSLSILKAQEVTTKGVYRLLQL